MSKTDIDRMFDQLEALSVGFAPMFRDFHHTSNNYPPHNIKKLSEDEFELELAVAGFKKSEVTIQEDKGLLTIRGEKAESDSQSSYQHRGIAGRSFSKNFRIAEFFEIKGATMEDGILAVRFVKNVPEESKPKLISIS